MAGFNQITWDGKSSFDDYGLTIQSKEIGNPAKKKVRVPIPGGNGYYDYAPLLGEQYEERKLKYVFNLLDNRYFDKRVMNNVKIKVLNWLIPGTQRQLFDDAIPGFYFMAEVQNAPSFSEKSAQSTLTVEFTAYPLKIGQFYEGNDHWDDYNLDFDVFQDTEFDVAGSKQIILINASAIDLLPNIKVNGDITVSGNGVTTQFSTGEYSNTQVVLKKRVNYLTLTGTGHISFLFRKELL